MIYQYLNVHNFFFKQFGGVISRHLMHFILIHFKLSIKSANFLEPYLLWEANNNKRVCRSLLRLHFHSQLRKLISGKLAFSNNYSYASFSSSCTQPSPFPETAEHLPSLLALGVVPSQFGGPGNLANPWAPPGLLTSTW